ncbi:unnamed protein product [Moneuplotes crassus]|uniref:Uncharacterized protein n=1 Tax=Euplotes crassus TaxID=5936 RepID=A0AAD1Y3Y3_EUPCR|nr:unnamed protein product [Moneuplotes crassus]
MRILQGLTMNKQRPKKTLGANKSNFSLKTLDILGSKSPEKRTLENHNVDEPYFSTITKNLEINTPVKKASAKLKPLDSGYCSSTERSLSFPEHIYKLRKLEEKQTDLNDLSSAFFYLQSPIGCSPSKRMMLSNQESPQKKGKTSRFLYSEVKEGLKPQLYQNTPKKKLYKLPEKLSQIVKKPVKDPVRKVKNTKRKYCLNSLKIQGIKDPCDYDKSSDTRTKETDTIRIPGIITSCKVSKRDQEKSFTTVTSDSLSFSHDMRGIDRIVIKSCSHTPKKPVPSKSLTKKNCIKPVNFLLQTNIKPRNRDF